jgi:Zn-dependent protease
MSGQHDLLAALFALLNGDQTARLSGRLTLNPVRHFDLVGFLLFAFFRVGYAKAVPINPSQFKNEKVGIITVALSGVTLNLLMSFLSVPIIMLLRTYLLPAMAGSIEGARGYYLIEYVFQCVFIVGVNLFLFNLIPFYPLDGYNVVEGFFGCTSPLVRWLRDYAKYIFIIVVVSFSLLSLFGVPQWLNPAYWYMTVLGGKIRELFWNIWLPLFV